MSYVCKDELKNDHTNSIRKALDKVAKAIGKTVRTV
jgi:hypothetical protein